MYNSQPGSWATRQNSQIRLNGRDYERGGDIRNLQGKPTDRNTPNEIPVLMVVLVEWSPGVFKARFVTNEGIIENLRSQGALRGFLEDADQLYADFRRRSMTLKFRSVPIDDRAAFSFRLPLPLALWGPQAVTGVWPRTALLLIKDRSFRLPSSEPRRMLFSSGNLGGT